MDKITWEEVEEVIKSMLTGFEGKRDYELAKEIWDIIEKSGRTEYDHSIPKVEAKLYSLAVVELVNDITAQIRDWWHESDYDYWMEEMEVNVIRIAQIAGRDLIKDYFEDYDSSELTTMVFNTVLESYRPKLAAIIFSKYEAGEFLMLINKIYSGQSDTDDEEDEEEEPEDVIDFEFDHGQPNYETYQLYNWIYNGMDRINFNE